MCITSLVHRGSRGTRPNLRRSVPTLITPVENDPDSPKCHFNNKPLTFLNSRLFYCELKIIMRERLCRVTEAAELLPPRPTQINPTRHFPVTCLLL